MGQPGSLRRQMAGDLNIKPVLNLGSQMKDSEGHGGIPLQLGAQQTDRRAPVPPIVKFLSLGGTEYISYPDDRFQYLSVNIR